MYIRDDLPASKKLVPGVDLPSWFIHDMKALDNKFHFVYHKYNLMWDDLMNYHTGLADHPRFNIHEEFGAECWGWPLTDNEGNPVPEHKWHVWRRVEDVGYYHVIDVASSHGEHLLKILKTLHLQALLRDRGRAAYVEAMKQEQQEEEIKKEILAKEKWEYIQDVNAPLIRKVKENFESGNVRPTNPTKESIMSYPHQKNRSRIIRPLDDSDVGLVGWDDVED